MNKLFTKIASLSVGLALAVGVGVAVGGQKVSKVVRAADLTAEKTTNDLVTEHGWTVSAGTSIGTLATSFALDSHITISTSGDPNCGSIWGTSTNDWRLYQAAKGDVTVTAGEGYELKSITFTYTISNTGTLKDGSTVVASGSTQTVTGTSKTYTVGNTGTKTNGQVRVTKFKVVYTEAGGGGTVYEVSDRVDNGSLSVSSVAEGATLSCTITPDVGYVLPTELDYVYMAGSPVEYTYVDGVVTVENVQGNIAIQGECPAAPADRIQSLYSKASGATVNTYGYYVGFLDGTGPVIMDGEYGIVLYNSSADVSSYTVNETILHVTGSISIYKGLYEVASPAMEVATSVPEDNVPATPVVYAVTGSETAEYASRLTTVTGTPSVTGTFPETAGSSDITITMTLASSKTVQVFFKKAAQTADADAFAAMKAAVTNSTVITVKGFTGWYNNFQVQMKGYIPVSEDYTAEDFAQELLDLTDAVCAGWKEGDNNHDAIEAIWSDLQADDKYPSLAPAEKQALADAERDEEGTTIEQAMARYDYLTGRYKLSNFIDGRTPMELRPAIELDTVNNNTMIIIVAIAAVSAISLAVLLVLKKKKHN